MKVVLIDDEYRALNYLEFQLSKIAQVDIIGKFADPLEGQSYTLEHDVDLLFMDIHLPEVNGIELAERLIQCKPHLHIVFVTAYDNYAIKAFELNALDYMLKPVSMNRLLKTLERIPKRLSEESAPLQSNPNRMMQMRLFQQALLKSDHSPYVPIRWRTTKAQELFLYLLQHRGLLLRKSSLIDMLWPEYEPDRSLPLLYTTVYHIRKTLGEFGEHFQIENLTDGYILTLQNVSLDVEEWENAVNSALPVTEQSIHTLERAMLLYTGDYLQQLEYWWVESERHRLKVLWLRASLQMTEYYSSHGQLDKALKTCTEICDRQPQAEEGHWALMKLYASSNHHLAVHDQYQLLTAILQEELNERPGRLIIEWYNRWIEENKE